MQHTRAGDDAADMPTWPQEFRERYIGEGLWRDETFAGTIDRLAAGYGNRIALIDGDRRLTYAELQQRVHALAAGLSERGLVRGDKAVVQMPNSIAFVEITFALMRLGVVPVLALPAHRHLEIGRFLEFVEARAFFIADRAGGFDYRGLARDLRPGLPALEHVVVDGEAEEFLDLSSLYKHGGTVPDAPSPDDVAVFQISGGTTGVPKLIPRRHNEYLYNIRTAAEVSGMDGDTVYLCALPVAHNFPLACPGIIGTFMQGGTVVMAPDPGADTAFALMDAHKVTIAAVVPPLALLWMEEAEKRNHRPESLQVLQVGGAKMSAEPARHVGPKLGCTLQQVFGMAEGLICFTRLDDPQEVIVNTQGRPMSPGDEIRVVDADGNDVPVGETGELLTRGPYTIRGYYRVPEHNARAFTPDGFYRTGDIVRLAFGGNIVVSGRDKDQINRGGEKISPEEVENLLLAHDDIHDVAVVGLPDAMLGERICAFAISRSGQTKALALTRHLRSRGLASFKMPDDFVFVANFPETGIGKISKKELREKLKQLHLDQISISKAG
ncbi:AMP-binding protein [Neorhizobium sp. JUb45]|uniref:(2,3-dihydroxybenzoyl)adenylate synthase n=1 Tax=unclassified Neorhizobium TaxID=2629175 RepID=UPI001052C26B|nr:AMP-binding protein [Neorhizobium sp. JUb45]TCR02728.1 2,3-dihydroxybenzoate-AMP ligase/pyochelin biosynthesis protein PchD [Neorhizobium sp. JUb45]